MSEHISSCKEQATVADMERLSERQKLNMLKEAKPGTWYDGWKPYCLQCDTHRRMEAQPYGFRCPMCKNMIGFDLRRLKESPLNRDEQ